MKIYEKDSKNPNALETAIKKRNATYNAALLFTHKFWNCSHQWVSSEGGIRTHDLRIMIPTL